MRRQALGRSGGFGGAINVPPLTPLSLHDELFYGPWGSLNPSGDLILETRAWRDKLFASRETPTDRAERLRRKRDEVLRLHVPRRHGRDGRDGAQPAARRDGRHRQPAVHAPKCFTNRTNTLLDASFIVPRRIKGRSLRIPAPRPRKEQVYFIGATNVPIDRLDPALIRPGRMGRHVWFRTPTKHDRLDIIDLYINKVSHDPELDMPTAPRRDRAGDERLLAGDDRAGHVDGADDRAPLGPRASSAGRTSSSRSRRSSPARRSGSSTSSARAGRSRSTRPATRSRATPS